MAGLPATADTDLSTSSSSGNKRPASPPTSTDTPPPPPPQHHHPHIDKMSPDSPVGGGPPPIIVAPRKIAPPLQPSSSTAAATPPAASLLGVERSTSSAGPSPRSVSRSFTVSNTNNQVRRTPGQLARSKVSILDLQVEIVNSFSLLICSFVKTNRPVRHVQNILANFSNWMDVFRKAQGNVDEWLPTLSEEEFKECLITQEESQLKVVSPSSATYSLHNRLLVERMAEMSSKLRYGSVDEIGYFKEDATFEWLHIDIAASGSQSGVQAPNSIAAAFDLTAARNMEAELLEAKAFAKLFIEAILDPGFL
eukprot:TRINITY_DN5773_c0_g2_i3.p1 TRINITY_DN5773_c0_g2~~TRINITY_DN5773_c0_g2_i3.p1  ORF type:complete len:309 (-),score=40.94 TRINITY_DN5773_c0_g2_i3:87-1013(-)